MGTPENPDIHWQASAKTDSNSIIRLGFWSVGVVFLAFLLWASLFPLSSAVITPGTFVSDGKNKLVQHQRGGRVREIFVREGEQLLVDQPILALDETQVQADLTQLEARHASLNALKSRLDAERSGGLRKMTTASLPIEHVALRGGSEFRPKPKPALTLRGQGGEPIAIGEQIPPPDLMGSLIKKAAAPEPVESTLKISSDQEFIDSQRDAYFSGRELLSREIESLNQKVETLKKQKDGLLARVKAQQTMLDMNRREYDRLKPLAVQAQ